MRLELLTLEPGARIMLRPHPEARHETFVEVLAAMKRAGIYRIRLACAEGP
jgi:biopolymer transport protein ExbD